MYDFATDETRTYAPAESADVAIEDFPQLTITDTGWTDEERNAMCQHGYDGMDMLMEWLS